MSEPLPEGQPPVAPEAPAEPEVEYAQIPVEEWQQIQQTLQQIAPLAEYVQQLPPEQEQQVQQQPQQQLDPFAENFQEQLDSYIDQRVAPIASYTQEQQMAEMSERAHDILSDYAKEQGFEFLNDDSAERALILANHYVAEEAERYGVGTEAAEAAIARAADDIRAWEQSVGQAYQESQMNQLRTVSGAPQQPQVAGAPAAQTLATPGTGTPAERSAAVLQKYYPG